MNRIRRNMLGAVPAGVARVVVLIVLVGWPTWAVLREASQEGSRTEPGPTLSEHRPALALNTLGLVTATLGLALPAGTALALVLLRTDLPCRGLWGLLCLVPMLVPLELEATAWLAAAGPQGLARSLGMPIELRGIWGAAWIHAMASIPWVVALAGTAIWSVEPELEEDCLLVAGPVATILRVTMRRALGGTLAAGLVVAAMTAGEMAVTDLLQVRSYAETVYTEFAVFGRPGVAAATALRGLWLPAALLLTAAALAARGSPQSRQRLNAPRRVFRLGRWRPAAVAGVVLAIGLGSGVPVASLIWRAGIEYPRKGEAGVGAPDQATGQVSAAPERPPGPRWSWNGAVTSFVRGGEAAGAELGFSLKLALMTSLSVVPLGWWLAWGARSAGFGRAVAAITATLLLCLPGPVLGAGLALALNEPPADWVPGLLRGLPARLADSPAVLVWALGLRTLPAVLFLLWPAVRLVDETLLEAAAVDGAGPWRRAWHVILPASIPPLLAAMLISAVLSIGEVSASVIVAPPGIQPLSVRVFTLAHFGVENYLAGICLVLLAVSTAGGSAALLMLRWAASRV